MNTNCDNGKHWHILVTGAPRSGTTWVGKTISESPDVRYIQEPFNVSFPNKHMGLRLDFWFTHYQSSKQRKQIQNAFDILFEKNLFRRIVGGCRQADLGLGNLLSFFKYLAINPVSHRLLIKDPIALLSADWLSETYQLSVVCMIKSPLAFVASLKKAGWDFDFKNLDQQELLMQGSLSSYDVAIKDMCLSHSSFVDRACLLWNILHFCILQYKQKYPSWVFLRYEDIAVNPVQVFEEVFDKLELPMDSKVKRYIECYTNSDSADKTRSNLYRPRNPRKVLDEWKRILSAEEVNQIRAATTDIASHFYCNGV